MSYGLIAGNGSFPFLVIDGANRSGTPLSVIAIKEETSKEIDKAAENVLLGRDRKARQDDLFFQSKRRYKGNNGRTSETRAVVLRGDAGSEDGQDVVESTATKYGRTDRRDC